MMIVLGKILFGCTCKSASSWMALWLWCQLLDLCLHSF